MSNEAQAGQTIDLGGGTTLTIRATGADTGDAYAVMEYVAGPGAGSGWHTHAREDEAFYILDGTLQFVIEDESFTATAGDYVHIRRGRRHAFRNDSQAPARALIIVAPAGLEQFFVDLAALTADGSPDPAAIADLTRRYGLTFA
jgi:quercetin dioxygenase-like cupin family protein